MAETNENLKGSKITLEFKDEKDETIYQIVLFDAFVPNWFRRFMMRVLFGWTTTKK